MRSHLFEAEQRIDRPLAEVFEFFSRAGNLERITPPWLRFALTGGEPETVGAGTLIAYKLRIHGVPVGWVTRIEEFETDRFFVDTQLRGPYSLWLHRHEFEADGDGTTIVRDRIRYRLPFGIAGALAHLLFVRRDVERIFAYRRQALERIFA